jgi:N6-L-threonylcarbamoyladenine synthase
MKKEVKILGIETSCDETAVAIVDSNKKIIANEVYSQIDEHEDFLGVVPEIAARTHMQQLEALVRKSFSKSSINLEEIDAIAVTNGPGLIGGLIVGLMYAKALSFALSKPLISVNHLEAHALTARLTHDLDFPFLLLLASGGHTQIIIVEALGKYRIIGKTLDDAIGESFDKVAKMLNLGYPGGPIVEKMAKKGESKIKFPIPLLGRKGCDFSLSGLKTSVRNYIKQATAINENELNDICCSFQFSITNIIQNRLKNAVKIYKESYNQSTDLKLVFSGGVASNYFVRSKIEEWAKQNEFRLICPPPKLCTDNAAMVAWVGVEKFNTGNIANLEIAPRAKWSIEDAWDS